MNDPADRPPNAVALRPLEQADPAPLVIALSPLERACPYLFAVLALAITLFLAWNVPPFMGADEGAHAQRADLGAIGRLLAERTAVPGGVISGGPIETGIGDAWGPFDKLKFHPEIKATTALYTQASQPHLGGPIANMDFRGSAIYPPFFYLPASAAFALGRAAHLTVVDALYLARGGQALAYVAIGFIALLLAGRSRLLVYSVLMLPMAIFQGSTVTSDGLLIVLSALGCVLVGRAMAQDRPISRAELIWATICFALVGMTKPPYALFGLVFIVIDAPRRWRAWAVGVVLAVSIGWALWLALAVAMPGARDGVVIDPAGQIAYLLGHLTAIPALAVNTLATNWKGYLQAFIGILGWYDTPLPGPYYILAWAMLLLGAAISASRGRSQPWRATPWVAVVIMLAVIGGIYAALYVTWSPVGAPIVDGVAGRYFLPVACFAALALEGRRPLVPSAGRSGTIRAVLTAAVLAFPLLTLMVVERAIVLRYYLQ